MAAEYLKRIVRCLAGLILCGVGIYFTVQATSIGIGAWETFQTGLSYRTGLAFGTCTVIVSFSVIIIDFLLGGKIGVGTICNAVIVGKTVDFCHAYCNFLPETHSLVLGICYLCLGFFLNAVGSVIYMKPALGCGPRDTLMVVLAKKFPDVNIGIVRFFIEMCVFGLGVLLGAPYGWGTVFAVVSVSFILQATFKLFRFRARDVKHEDLRDTFLRIRGKS